MYKPARNLVMWPTAQGVYTLLPYTEMCVNAQHTGMKNKVTKSYAFYFLIKLFFAVFSHMC